MIVYCEGSACSKRDSCQLHNPGVGTYQCLDWSSYGSANFWQDIEAKYHNKIDYCCGDAGNFKKFIPKK